jgi:hypothetical protein
MATWNRHSTMEIRAHQQNEREIENALSLPKLEHVRICGINITDSGRKRGSG